MATNPICLPPGFRFHPTDEELVGYYLNRKVHGHKIEVEVIPEVDIYHCEPWDLPEMSCLPSEDLRWHFFCARARKYSNGSRTNRATHAGYWKSTGKDRKVTSSSCSGQRTIGTKKTLVFYKGRAPFGQRTDWIMHEYKLEKRECQEARIRDDFVLCHVFKKKSDGIGRGTDRDEIKNSSIDSMPKMVKKEAEDGREDSNEQLPQSSQVDIDKWVEMLMDEPDPDDQCSNLDYTAPSDDPKKINYLDEEASPLQQMSACGCPLLMVDQRIPISRNFPLGAFVHGCQSPNSADGPSADYTGFEGLLSAAQMPQIYDKFHMCRTLNEDKRYLKGEYIELDDLCLI